MNKLKEKFLNMEKKQKITIISILAAVILIAVILVCIVISKPKEEEIITPPATPSPTPTATQTPEPTPTPADIPIDFTSWRAYNSDVYAWIYVPGTSVNYPILQHPTESDYYLNRNLDGSEGYPGSIYTEIINSKDFSDMHTVLYGHNMRAGYKYKGMDATMFRTLHKFEDDEFFNTHRYFYIYTENQVLTYEIFAAYTFDNRHLLNCYALENDGVFQEYINNIYLQKDGHIRQDCAQVTAADKIVTMETCTGNSSTRFLVVGVLRSQEPGAYKELPDDSASKAAVSVTSFSGQ